jgi:hypothetical protein
MPISRRDLIASGAVAAGWSAPGGPASSGTVYDPRSTAEGQVKLGATLDGSPAFWVYSGVIYGVRPGRRPLPILTLAGGQSSWAERRPNGDFMVRGAILTFFRDPDSNAFLETFDNPLTGKRNLVKANSLSGGGLLYPADGSSARLDGEVKAGVVAPKGFEAGDLHQPLGAVRWSVVGSSVTLMTDRAWNVAVQPQLEAQTQFADRDAFFNRRRRRMTARFSATTIVPWMAWMEMGDSPGHLVWHSSGEKVFSIDDMPADYRNHAGSALDLLATRPAG